MAFINRFVKYTILILVFFMVIFFSANLLINRDTVTPPHIEPVTTNVSIPAPVYSFPFEDVTITLTSTVDSPVYFGAKTAKKETVVQGNVSDDRWLRETYLAMVSDPYQNSFYSSLITTLRSIRDQQNLTDDEYLELITAFVQSIPYETQGENPPKFPVETFVDRSGDCDDKSLLLTGLLSREGYNVSLMSFTPESHMAVGIVCPGGEYQQTGYAFIETTNFSFVGVPTDTLGTDIPLRSNPQVIRIGNGTKTYRSCTESLYLNSVYELSEENVMDLTKQIDALKTEMDGYYANRDAKNYNQRVSVFNDLQHTRMEYAEIHNYILGHQYDRNGTYYYVKANLPA
jgi:hypothetical protein